jgi:hypothetical protein
MMAEGPRKAAELLSLLSDLGLAPSLLLGWCLGYWRTVGSPRTKLMESLRVVRIARTSSAHSLRHLCGAAAADKVPVVWMGAEGLHDMALILTHS